MFYKPVSKKDFHEDFGKLRPGNFSPEGLDALFNYCQAIGRYGSFKFDVHQLCRDFAEYKDLDEFKFGGVKNAYIDDCLSWDDVQEHTTVIRVGDKGAIVRKF